MPKLTKRAAPKRRISAKKTSFPSNRKSSGPKANGTPDYITQTNMEIKRLNKQLARTKDPSVKKDLRKAIKQQQSSLNKFLRRDRQVRKGAKSEAMMKEETKRLALTEGTASGVTTASRAFDEFGQGETTNNQLIDTTSKGTTKNIRDEDEVNDIEDIMAGLGGFN